MKKYALLFLLLTACNAPTAPQTGSSSPTASCRGTYTSRDSQGNLKKWNEYDINGQCFTDNVPLTKFESTTEAWARNSYSCNPVSGFTSRTLVSANNFYSYRDGKQLLDLDSASGIYRKVTLAEGKDGRPIFTRLQGCFYVRGTQLLLDTVRTVTSQDFDPMEIFEFTSTATTMELTRFDDSGDWDYRFCPDLDTPFGFCDLLRDGNDMYYPNLNAGQKAAMLAEALLIRKQFNYQTVSRTTFNSLWNNTGNRTERVREDYKFAVQAIVDTPRYIDQAWAEYVRGNRPTMPDVTSTRIPYLCYDAHRTITLSDGTTSRINGEVCYVDGQYVFTQ